MLKLFVWQGVLCDQTCGMVVAMAHDVEEARRLAYEKNDSMPEDTLDEEPEVVTEPTAFIVWGGA